MHILHNLLRPRVSTSVSWTESTTKDNAVQLVTWAESTTLVSDVRLVSSLGHCAKASPGLRSLLWTQSLLPDFY